MCARDNFQVWPFCCRLQIGLCCRCAQAVFRRDLEQGSAVHIAGIIVGVGCNAGLFGRFQIGAAERMYHGGDIRNPQRATAAAFLVRCPLPVFHAPEHRFDIIPAPARGHILPFCKIAGVAAYIDHRIDGGGAAQNLAARPVDGPVIQVGLWFGIVFPVETPVIKHFAIADGNMKPRVFSPGTRLENENTHVLIFT